MQNETLEIKRTPEGVIDVRHYARIGVAERRAARNAATGKIGHGAKRAVLAAAALVTFWNVPPMGSAGSKDMPYR